MTLVELLVASVIMALLATLFVPFWRQLQQFITSSEALTVLKRTTAADLRTLQREMECRLFFHGTSGAPFLARVNWGGLPPALGQSRLANADGVSTVAMAMAGAAVPNGGNMLLMLKGLAPEVVSLGGVDYKISQSRFLLIYIAEDPSKTIGGSPRRYLAELKSAVYLDYEDMVSLPLANQLAIGAVLYARGFRYAFSSGALNPSTAFFLLDLSGALVADPPHLLVQSELVPLSQAITGQTLSGYRIGVCPNTTPAMGLRLTIPQFQNVRGDSPSGFEVFAGGPPESRQVLIRLVMAAEGGFPRMLVNEQSTVVVVRDTQ